VKLYAQEAIMDFRRFFEINSIQLCQIIVIFNRYPQIVERTLLTIIKSFLAYQPNKISEFLLLYRQFSL